MKAGKQKHWDMRTFSDKEHRRRDFSQQRNTKKSVLYAYIK